jgi:hypothetical protein
MPAAKPVYGVLGTDVAKMQSDEARTTVALLCLVTVLATATVWFVALPLVDRQDSKPQSCEMFVLTSAGVMRCVPETTGAAAARTDA